MIDLLFSDSACGGLLQSKVQDRKHILCLDLKLHIGDIRCAINDVRRIQSLQQVYDVLEENTIKDCYTNVQYVKFRKMK